MIAITTEKPNDDKNQTYCIFYVRMIQCVQFTLIIAVSKLIGDMIIVLLGDNFINIFEEPECNEKLVVKQPLRYLYAFWVALGNLDNFLM